LQLLSTQDEYIYKVSKKSHVALAARMSCEAASKTASRRGVQCHEDGGNVSDVGQTDRQTGRRGPGAAGDEPTTTTTTTKY